MSLPSTPETNLYYLTRGSRGRHHLFWKNRMNRLYSYQADVNDWQRFGQYPQDLDCIGEVLQTAQDPQAFIKLRQQEETRREWLEVLSLPWVYVKWVWSTIKLNYLSRF